MSRLADYRVDGGVALVTGAAGGIGAALAERLVRDGSNLVLVDRNREGLDAVAEQMRVRRPDRQVTVITADLSERDAAADVVAQALADQDRLTLVVNNAGVALAGRFEQVSMDDVDWLLAINLRAVLAVTSAALPHLGPGAQITNVSSLFGIIAPVGNSVYSASKFGVRGRTEALEIEWRRYGIRVIAMWPLFVATAMVDGVETGSTKSLGVHLDAEDVAAAVYQATHPERKWPSRVHYPVGGQTRVLAALSQVSPNWATRLLTRTLSRT